MKLKLIATILLCFWEINFFASPTNSKFSTYKQLDGTEISLCKKGDEFFHYYMTLDGIPVIEADNGGLYYGIVSDASITISDKLAHNINDRSNDEEAFTAPYKDTAKHLSKLWHKLRVDMQAHSMQFAKALKRQETNNKLNIGKKKGLVILVEFANANMNGDTANSDFDRMFNEIGYSEDNHIGSVHDYFYDQSFGQFDLTFDVVGPIRLSKNYGYYGQNLNEFRGDKRAGSMVIEACKAVDDIVDFKKYDWDNDGIVETVYVVYAGYGENASDDSSTIWPHKSSLSSRGIIGDGDGSLSLDDVIIDIYACSAELAGASGLNRNGIGTPCHEFSHCLGLPDLYDTDYSGAFGMNKWDVMDSGSYSGPNERGEVPYGYSAFERASVGWMDIDILQSNNEYILPPLNDHPNAFMLINDGNENEYFIIENHQSVKWYSYVGKYTGIHGMMVTHVDYDENCWERNTVNSNPSHMRESIVPADKSYGIYNSANKYFSLSESDFRGDLFPGIKDVNRFSTNEYENCGGKLFNINTDQSYNVNLNIDNIVEEDGVIFFTAGKPIDAPTNVSVSQIDDKLEIKWISVQDAEEYIIELYKIKSILPSRIEKEIIDNIYNTTYIVDGIDCKQCVVKVKAKNKYVSSEWSEQVKIAIDPNAVSEIYEDNAQAEYFTIDGVRSVGTTHKGVYIVKQNGGYKKIYLR